MHNYLEISTCDPLKYIMDNPILIVLMGMINSIRIPGLFPAILGEGPWPKLGKIINLTSKLGEINDIEHNKCSKIYPQNQVILDCTMSSIPLKHKCLSSILMLVIDSHK